MKRKVAVIGFTALLVGTAFWLGQRQHPHAVISSKKKPAVLQPQQVQEIDWKWKHHERQSSPESFQDDEAERVGALKHQRTFHFASREALENFLTRAGQRVLLTGRLDSLNVIRIVFSDLASLKPLLSEAQVAMIFPVKVPENKSIAPQIGAVKLNDRLLEWLGVSGMDRSAWGKGVLIAILDTGIVPQSAFSGKITSLDLKPGESISNGHGTAVASTIVSTDSRWPGVAPQSELLSIRVADANGISDSFTLAQAISEAADRGAALINISMGGSDSAVLKQAVDYATAKGSLIVAATGNDGGTVSYPAAYESVFAIGAVDAAGVPMNFSNSGVAVDMAAPGFGINAAYLADQAISATGTSFSAPIVTGALAAIMSTQPNLSAQQAAALLGQYANDVGNANQDAKTGVGVPNLQRVFQSSTSGIHAAAVTSVNFLEADNSNSFPQIEIPVQNRGTEPLYNTLLTIQSPAGTVTSNINSLAPNETRSIFIPASFNGSSGVTINAQLSNLPKNADNQGLIRTVLPPQ